ncbi:MAG: energy transducer TonB [Rhizobacter sp.]
MNSVAITAHAPLPSAHRPIKRRVRGTTINRPNTVAIGADAPPLEAVLPHKPDSGSHVLGLATVVLIHVLVGYALVSGLAQKLVDTVRAPIEARLIEEIKLPPPPPPPPVEKIKPVVKVTAAPPPPFVPPPEVQVATPPPAPTIAAVTPTPPPAPVEFKPEPAPAIAPPPAPAAPPVVAIGVACPQMVNPVMPRRAQQEGIGGAVKARATIRDGKVVDVQILSSTPRGLFDSAVRSAMAQYGCSITGSTEIVAVQNFVFKAAE